ncbi:alpha-E domain-containing protein, partial [Mesorhizobium sp. M4B.F.Ca.ET.049.02.1.2]
VLDAIKRETALIRGSFYGTMLRNEIFDFSQLGTYVERADNTARILDVKYYVLLPSISWVGSTLDNYQWESILRSVSAHRSYRWVYDADYKPTNIADYLILNVRMPRSLTFCYRFLAEHLKFLGDDYGERHACHATAEKTQAMLRAGSIKDIFDAGLHEFLANFIRDNTRLGDEIAQDYRFY